MPLSLAFGNEPNRSEPYPLSGPCCSPHNWGHSLGAIAGVIP